MNSKITLLVASLFVAPMLQVYASEAAELDVKGVTHYDRLRVKNLRVCENAQFDGNVNITENITVTGNEVVVGSVAAGSFILSPTLAVGTVGVPGLGGDLAYGEVQNVTAQTVLTNGIVTFSELGLSAGVTNASTSITVANDGIYRIQYQVLGTPATDTEALIFGLTANNVGLDNSIFSSGLPTAGVPTETLVVNGFCLVELAAGEVIRLQSLTASTVTLPVTGATNAALLVERIA